MAVRKLKEGIYEVGAIDWDRRLFDELIPLPDGTSYNSYLVIGKEKIALIDTVDPSKEQVLIENIKKLNIKKIDYIISNHAEQDHSGTIPKILELYPGAKVVTNEKCKGFLKDLLFIPEEKFITVKDKDTISLGDKTLEFIFAPWVHWPETMFTYLREDKVLFTCDFLGSHVATTELFAENEPEDDPKAYPEVKRYYAEIMMPFRSQIKKHLKTIKELDIDIIAPSHGVIYKHSKAQSIIKIYEGWVSDNVKNEVLIPYTSMHESTKKMVSYVINKLSERGISIKPFNLTSTDIGELAMALVDAATIVIGSPMVLGGPHPAIVSTVYLINALRPKTKYISIIGSYGWGGRLEETIKGLLTAVKAEFLPSVISKGHPDKKDYEALDLLIEEIAKRHANL